MATIWVGTPNAFAMTGKAGKYISIDNGPSEVNNANNNIQAVEYCCEDGCGVPFELGIVFAMVIFYDEMAYLQTSLHAP